MAPFRIKNPGPMLHSAMKGMSRPKPSTGWQIQRQQNQSAYVIQRSLEDKEIDVAGMMLVMKISVRPRRLFLSLAFVNIAASASATNISSGTVLRK